MPQPHRHKYDSLEKSVQETRMPAPRAKSKICPFHSHHTVSII